MPAYSFKTQFIDPIKSGEKSQTIRGKRKSQAKPGDTVYLYYGMRTKWCTKIGEAICYKVSEIVIGNCKVFVDGKKLNANQRETLAKQDGFEGFYTMMLFWEQNNVLPFVGDIIYWKDLKPATK